MSAPNIDYLMDLWAFSLLKHGDTSPFENAAQMYQAIDDICLGDAPWKCLETEVPDNLPASAPEWEQQPYQIWLRDIDTVCTNMLDNPDLQDGFESRPYIHVSDGKRRWGNFMSGNFAWRHAVCPRLFTYSHTV